jgi:predicted  nucleic acid-binding Zn-ribbon protein
MFEDINSNLPTSAPEVAPSGRPIPVLSNAAIVAALRQITDRQAEMRTELSEVQQKLAGLSGDKAENYLALTDAVRDLDNRLKDLREEFDQAVK